MSTSTKLALVGCGGISAAHLNGYRDLHERGCRDFEIVACCDIAKANAETRAEEILTFQGTKPRVFESTETLVKSGAAEAADVCLPHAFHHSTTIELLQGGLHVLLEKPIGITIQATRKIMEAADIAGRILATAENIRRMPGPRACRWALCEAKLIGDVHAIHVNQNAYGPFDFSSPGMKWRGVKLITGGGMIMDSGAHLGDMMVHMFGDPDEVYCRMFTHNPEPFKDLPGFGDGNVDTEDTWQLIMSFKSGVQLNWTYTRIFPGASEASGHYYGTKGTMADSGFVMHPFQNGGSLVESDGTVRPSGWVERQYMDSLSDDEKNHLFPFGATDGFSIEVFDFIRAIRTGQPVEMDGEAGLRAKTLCMACYESAEAGTVVKYDDVLDGSVSAYQDPIDAHWGI
jgi:predicted dehydrogenase